MLLISALTLMSAKKALDIEYTENVQVDGASAPLLARAHYLAQWKQTIDQMPEGFEKLDAQRDWFKEVDQLLAITKPANASHSNIVHLYKLRH